jgi:hypothetical protein
MTARHLMGTEAASTLKISRTDGLSFSFSFCSFPLLSGCVLLLALSPVRATAAAGDCCLCCPILLVLADAWDAIRSAS